ncbi:MAG: hypothetical protein J0L92_33340 [Deltaproteobacteria bacterium]|nr:hypothetical protein [Deltaproteobacteria bacterium]
MTFRDDRDAQQHRIEQLEQALEDARRERDQVREERDDARADLARTDEERAARKHGASFAVGAEVYVEWQGRWWKAIVRDAPGGGRWLIHYEGWSRSWDETVGPDRIVARTATPPGPLAGDSERGTIVVILVVVLITIVLALGWLTAR